MLWFDSGRAIVVGVVVDQELLHFTCQTRKLGWAFQRFGPQIDASESPPLPIPHFDTKASFPMAGIPNLNTLRTGRGGPRLRGSRRGGRAIPENNDAGLLSPEQENAAKDRVVQQTDNDASFSRLSALELGYLEDEYARLLMHPREQVPKRYPIINRGTYVRSTAIDKLILRFLRHQPTERKQIISLGAGSDTRFLRLCGDAANVVYHELDFEANVTAKRAAFDRSQQLATRLKENQDDGAEYHLHATDLRSLASDAPPTLPGLDVQVPTLILSECCLCYLAPDQASGVLKYFTGVLTSPAGLIIYEPVRPFDAFGKTMVTNLASRGIHLQTLKRYSSLEAERQRLRLAGFSDGQGAMDVRQIWESDEWVSSAEKERVEKLEWLDEVEEWDLLASHYCVAWGWRGDFLGGAWGDVQGGRTKREDLDDELE